MNIIKQIFETPDTPSGKKRLNNLITRLGLGKKVKGDLMKDVVSGELGGGASNEYARWYYMIDSNKLNEDFDLRDDYATPPEEIQILRSIIGAFRPIFGLLPEEYNQYGYRYIKMPINENELSLWKINRKPYFVISDEIKITIQVEKDFNVVIGGNFEERLDTMIKLSGDLEPVKHFMKYITPITKEEFESVVREEVEYNDFINN